jgi:hypothetical protein
MPAIEITVAYVRQYGQAPQFIYNWRTHLPQSDIRPHVIRLVNHSAAIIQLARRIPLPMYYMKPLSVRTAIYLGNVGTLNLDQKLDE